ncbi:MAG: 50S ribosomal protein L24 [Acidimicrobiia bacterium]|nr:50S ribosomal protein L24 [Acidimicrobiia bacterium]
MKLRTGDRVKVVSGNDAGKTSRVARTMPSKNRIVVEGVNTAKKHQKPTRDTMQGGIIDRDMPIDASNVMIVCSNCGPTRISHRIDSRGRKIRVCAKCGGDL